MSNPATAEHAVLKTSYGEMTIAFWPEVAPKTVANFKKLAREYIAGSPTGSLGQIQSGRRRSRCSRAATLCGRC